MVRRWQITDGEAVGPPMNAVDGVYNIAVLQDVKWVVSGR